MGFDFVAAPPGSFYAAMSFPPRMSRLSFRTASVVSRTGIEPALAEGPHARRLLRNHGSA
jgi:hypothetical protein